jgi:hypothetical protein
MNDITVTHYTRGSGVRRYPPGEERMTVYLALADMFTRLRAGADLVTSGFNYGLVTYIGPENSPTGSDEAIYGGVSSQLCDFLIRAPKWWATIEDIEPGNEAHEHFIRRTLLAATGHDLSDKEMAAAMAMPEDQFLVSMSMSIENGENVTELFRSAV